MSLKKKLTDVATAAAIEATTNERARCLWCADQVVKELEGKLRKKLMSEAQLHTAQTKFKIAEAVVRELRRAIVSGIRPAALTQAAPGGPGGTDAADLSLPESTDG